MHGEPLGTSWRPSHAGTPAFTPWPPVPSLDCDASTPAGLDPQFQANTDGALADSPESRTKVHFRYRHMPTCAFDSGFIRKWKSTRTLGRTTCQAIFPLVTEVSHDS